jgi:hypothetical protein
LPLVAADAFFFSHTWSVKSGDSTDEASFEFNQEWKAQGDCTTTANYAAHCGLYKTNITTSLDTGANVFMIVKIDHQKVFKIA